MIAESFLYNYQVPYVRQSGEMGCWSAAASMLLGGRYLPGAGRARVDRRGGLSMGRANIRRFADSHDLVDEYRDSWTVEALVKTLATYGPVMVVGFIPTGHAVVIKAIWGDGTPAGTTLTIYDPGGTAGDVTFQALIAAHPDLLRYVLHRRWALAP